MKNSNEKSPKSDDYYIGLSRALNKLSGRNSEDAKEKTNHLVSENKIVCPCCGGRLPKIKEVTK